MVGGAAKERFDGHMPVPPAIPHEAGTPHAPTTRPVATLGVDDHQYTYRRLLSTIAIVHEACRASNQHVPSYQRHSKSRSCSD